MPTFPYAISREKFLSFSKHAVNMLSRGVSYYTLTEGLQTAQVMNPDFAFLFFYDFTRKGLGKYVLSCYGFVHCLPINSFYLSTVSVKSARFFT